MRTASRWGTSVLAAWLTMSASAAAQDACIAPAIERELACPEGMRPASPRRPGSAVVPVHAQVTQTTARATPGARTTALDIIPSERLEIALPGRERDILERLARRTPIDDPRRPDILWRLAYTYGELERGHEARARSLDEPIFRARGAERARLQRERSEAERDAQEARRGAVRALAQLVADHSSYAHTDEALYALAAHLDRMNERTRARDAYRRLIRDFSRSRYVPHAYLAFADHAFDEGRLDDARELYERVLAYPPEENPIYAYARYKLAWVHFNAERFTDALDALVRVIEHVRQHPDTPDAASLARQARRELVLPYARVGRPDRALAFFRRVADEADAIAMLERLGEVYLDSGRWSEAVLVHHRLMAERPQDAAMCTWQARVLDATISSRPKSDQVREARRLVELRALARGDADAARACDERTATSLVLLATAWHREAVGTSDQPGTRDRATMTFASELYALIERELPSLDTLTLSTIDARDRPSAARLAFFHAELLFDLERWPDCAEAYQRAIDDPALAGDAAYGAVLCYDRQLGSREPAPAPDDRALSPRALTEDEARMARAFARFACVAPTHEELPIVLYRWARLYYEANQFEQAAVLFRRISVDFPTSEVGEYAANLYLDAANVLLGRRGRQACLAEIAGALDPLGRSYCSDDAARAAHPDLCGVIGELRCDLGARHARELGADNHHREAAEAYLALARTRLCREEDAYLYNAAIEFEAVRLIGRAIRVRTTLIEAHPESPLARRSIYLVGANYHALAMYEQAAEHYERYAREQGREEEACTAEERDDCPDVALALENAVTFRLGLGDREHALEDARRIEALFARSEPARTVEVALAIGALYTSEARWPEVVAHHTQLLRRHRAVASADQLARAELAIGRALARSGDRARAEPHLRAAVAAFESASVTDEVARARLHDAVSEALFELAEAERERFEAIAFPTLRGPASLARVDRWAAEELMPWMEAKRLAFVAAEEAYGRVHPLAVPRWRIASAARIGDMVAGMVERVRGAPVPEVIARDPELLDAYWEALDRATEPYLAIAEQRYAYCLNTATETRFFDDRSRHCEEQLNRLDTARFPVAAELRGEPDYRPDEGAPPTAPSPSDSRDG